jgi:hypothetical protein
VLDPREKCVGWCAIEVLVGDVCMCGVPRSPQMRREYELAGAYHVASPRVSKASALSASARDPSHFLQKCETCTSSDPWPSRNRAIRPTNGSQPHEHRFGAVDTWSCPSRARMPLFKKSKKTRQPSQQLLSLGIPTHIAVGPLGFNADLDLNAGPEGAFRSVESSN